MKPGTIMNLLLARFLKKKWVWKKLEGIRTLQQKEQVVLGDSQKIAPDP